MVDSRFDRTLQRASLGIRTPGQTRTPGLFFPAGENGSASPQVMSKPQGPFSQSSPLSPRTQTSPMKARTHP